MKKIFTILSLITLTAFSFSAKAQITGDTAVCVGEKITYYAPVVAGASYSWVVSGGMISGTSIADTVVVSFPIPGPASILVTMITPANGVQTFWLNVIVHPIPDPKITHLPYPTCPPEGGENSGAGNPDHGGKDICEKVCEYATITYSTQLNPGSTYSWVASGFVSMTGAATNSVTVTWDNSPLGFLTVYETNQWGCVDSAKICVEKMPLPVALFTHQLSVCKNSNVQFNNLSTGATSWQWNFGDNSTSNAFSPTHMYTVAGTYTITLIAISDCYCTDTFQSQITVDSLPGPDITCPSTLCAFDTATYSTSTAGCIYTWFAIGGTIIGPNNLQSVTVAWGAGQMGTLGLTVSGCGALCSDTTWVNIPIIPVNGIISGPAKVCPGDCETFSLPLFSGAKYTWSLSSGACGTMTDSTCCNTVEICWPPFSGPCNDTLSVTFWDAFLNCGGTATKIIRLRPKLSILGQQEVCSNVISNYFSFPGVPCNWNISPAGPTLSVSPAPNVSVNWNGMTGTFVLTAVPANPNAVCNDSVSIIINVVAPPAAPVITGDTITCANSTAQYCATGSGTINWLIVGGTPLTSVGNCITVTWGNIPPFLVKSFVTMPSSPYCTSDTAIQNITVFTNLTPPVVNGPLIACANGTSNFMTPTLYPPGVTFNWYVSPGNAGTVIGGQGTPAAQIEWGNNAPQTVSVTLVVSVCGLKDSTTVSVTLNPAPNPVINQIGNLCPGSAAQLNVTGGVFTAYNWSGPGGFTGNTNPVTITQNGLYQVTVTDAGNCTALTQYTAFYVGVPVASITSQNPLVYCIGSAYAVNLCALGNPNYTYAWSNGPTSQCNIVTTPGAYNVTVTDAVSGCWAISNVLAVAEDSCIPDTAQCIPVGSVSFTHSSCNPKVFTNTSVNAGNFTWSFGDLTWSNLPSPTHLYNQAGFFLVTLTGKVPNTTGTDSCLMSDTQLIEIPLLARFNFTSGCNGAPVCFTDLSVTTAGNSIASWNWNFGDANTSTLQNPCHTYAGPGTYIVTLTISNPGCTTSFTDTVYIAPPPTAAFTIAMGTCLNSAVGFTDNSFSGINYWNWDFGNGGTSLNQNPSQSYGLPGPYLVTLIVHDTFGCYDTVQQNITITAPLVSGSITAFPDTIVCAGTPVTLAAPLCGTCTYLWSNGSVNDSITVTSTGIYAVTVTDANGCDWTDYQLIIVNQGPGAVITSTKNHLCLGEFATLSVPYSINWLYTWISNDPTVNGSTFPSVGFFPATSGLYNFQVVITDTTTGCTDTTLIKFINVHQPPVPPVITSIGSSVVCQGDTVQLVVTHPDPFVTFSWSTGEINDTIQVTEDGCYTVIATDTNGCTSQSTFCVTVNPLPELCTYYVGCFDTCAPYTIQGPLGAASYQWLLNGSPIAGATNQTYTATISGSYSVILTTAFGCTDTTGPLNLNLYPCGDTLCASLVIDSVMCDPATGLYVMNYYVINNSPFAVSQINLQVLPPHLMTAYAPNMVFVNLPPGDTSLMLTTLIYNGVAGDTLCFRTHIEAYDSLGHEILCCESDTFCVVLPECNHIELPCLCDQSLTICEDDTAYFQYFIFDPNTTYTWQFPGGIPSFATGMGPHAVYYPNPGVYPVQLMMSNSMGEKICIDTIYVLPKPIANIIPSGNMLFAQPPGMNYQWYNAPVTNANAIPGAVNQFFTPLVTGTYCVVVSNDIGCADTACIYFEGPDTSCCYFSYGGDSVWCEQSATTGEWVYHFSIQISGCGNLSVTPNNFGPFTINYPLVMTGGMYTITGTFISPTDSVLCLTFVVNDSTHYCADETICIALPDCQPQIPPCDNLTANFGVSVNGTSGTFTDLSTAAGGMVIIGWSWNFGDPASGVNNNSALPNPIHVFSGPGTYNVCLIVIGIMPGSSVICAKMFCHPVVIFEEQNPCDSVFAQFSFVSNMLTASFTDASTVPAPLVISSWSWNFDDIPSGANNFSNLQNPTHVFTTSGWYYVCLTVTAVHPLDPTVFCENKFCQKIFVEGPPVNPCDSLIADFSFTTSGLLANFTNQSYAGGGFAISNYSWNFGDPGSGVNNVSSLQNPVHTFTATGWYTVCLIIAAKDNFSNYCYDTICKEIFVEGPQVDPCDSLVASFTLNQLGLNVNFVNTSVAPWPLVITSWSWNFGDPASGANNFSNFPNPSHVFTATGFYTVCLTVGAIIEGTQTLCYDTICMEIFVEGIQPNPCDSLIPNFAAIGNIFVTQFFNQTLLPPGYVLASSSWNFGDPASGPNNTSNLQNPVHYFTGNGYFVVCLTVVAVNAVGDLCEATICKDVYISKPHVDVGVDHEIFTGGSIQLGAVVSGGTHPFVYEWFPATGLSNPLIPDPVAFPQTTTTYILVVTDSLGYVGSDTLVISVLPFGPSTVTGTILYTGTNQPLSHVALDLFEGTVLQDTTSTDISGHYSFTNLQAGTYQVAGSTGKTWGGVNATDALLVLKHFVGSSPLSGIRLKAADVDATNYVNAADALACMKRFVNQITSFNSGDWVFDSPSFTLATASTQTINFTGMCYGDVNTSYNPPTIKPEPVLFAENNGVIYVGSEEVVDIPVRIKQNTDVSAISLVLNYDSEQIEILDVLAEKTGEGLVYNTIGNELRIAWCTLLINSLQENDVLLTIKIRGKESNVSTSESIRFDLGAESMLSNHQAETQYGRTVLIPKLLHKHSSLTLSQNVPNPFSNASEITYSLPEDGYVNLTVYNALGEKVKTIAEGVQSAGSHSVQVNRMTEGPGFYYYQLEFRTKSGIQQKTRQMIQLN